MLLFCGNVDSIEGKIIVPLERVYNIITVGCRININYDSGEVVETEHGYIKKIDTVSVLCDSSDDADKILRQFYKSLNSTSNAFYFG